ncbi:hypothetical protein ACKGJO_13785 [Gracilimonas sp. Q87]|uniref:hypothetical protein n=1 Tax=Gracilimonas sp. Q87 TaxID=3384766 RepID=UPI0039840235
MKYFIYNFLAVLVLTSLGCSPSNKVIETSEQMNHDLKPDESISININEVIYFVFVKEESQWSGDLKTYSLNENNEKVVSRHLVSAQDSSWSDFDQFVEFLNIYQIPPQYEVDGWVPDSGELPQRVYTFEVFDGDTTRSFSYQDPERGIKEFWQAQSLLTFMTFVENELNWVEARNTE